MRSKPQHSAADREAQTLPKPATLDQQLESLEQRWFALLKAEFSDKPMPESASGEIQFFCTDFPATYDLSRDEEPSFPRQVAGSALCVVCVGINHNVYRDRHEDNTIIPHIYTRTRGKTWAFDLGRTRPTRRALNTALAFYIMNKKTWMENGYASDSIVLPTNWDGREADLPFVLIKTYLSPFISTKPWAVHSGTIRRETRHAWNPNRHICDLIAILGRKISLWVIQGNNLWPHFIKHSDQITDWILTPTLSYESDRSGQISTFFRTKRSDDRLVQPWFPACEGIS